MRRPDIPALALLALNACSFCGAAHAQEEVQPRRTYAIESSAAITETITDNGNLSANKRADLVTQPSIGLRASANSARLRGFLDYSLSGLVYANETARNDLLNALSAFATGTLVENRVFVDVGGSISQQAISPFGTQAADSALANPNRTEVSTFSVSPYARGRLGNFAEYEARVSYAATRSNAVATSDQDTSSAQLRIGSGTALTKLGWSAQASHTEIDYSLGRRTEDDVARGVLSWAITPELSVGAIAGRESNNYVSLNKDTHTISGFNAKWKPSERTTFSAERENRFFGESHAVTFTHRTARTTWSFSDVRDVSTNPGQPTLGSRGTAFDALFQLYAKVEPDPIARQLLVNEVLRINNTSPASPPFGAFLTSAVTLQRAQNLSFALLGLRDTLTFTASKSQNEQLDAVTPLNDFSLLRQRGLAVDLAHRLTPISTVSLNALYQRASGSLAVQTTTLKSIAAAWSARLGRRTDLALGARHAVFDSSSSPYDETAVYGTLRLQF
jgi:uncharacterized protein (PEP-CTERM system associated)